MNNLNKNNLKIKTTELPNVIQYQKDGKWIFEQYYKGKFVKRLNRDDFLKF